MKKEKCIIFFSKARLKGWQLVIPGREEENIIVQPSVNTFLITMIFQG
jgi:hypothetical protein